MFLTVCCLVTSAWQENYRLQWSVVFVRVLATENCVHVYCFVCGFLKMSCDYTHVLWAKLVDDKFRLWLWTICANKQRIICNKFLIYYDNSTSSGGHNVRRFSTYDKSSRNLQDSEQFIYWNDELMVTVFDIERQSMFSSLAVGWQGAILVHTLPDDPGSSIGTSWSVRALRLVQAVLSAWFQSILCQLSYWLWPSPGAAVSNYHNDPARCDDRCAATHHLSSGRQWISRAKRGATALTESACQCAIEALGRRRPSCHHRDDHHVWPRHVNAVSPHPSKADETPWITS